MLIKKAPIFEYDERYFSDCNYTREELHHLQDQILKLREKNPNTVLYEIKKISNIEYKEIQTILDYLENHNILNSN